MSTDMEMRQQSERFTLIEAATAPELPAAPNRPLYDGAAAIIAFGLALAIGFIIELRKNLFLGEWELPNGMPVLRPGARDHVAARSQRNKRIFPKRKYAWPTDIADHLTEC